MKVSILSVKYKMFSTPNYLMLIIFHTQQMTEPQESLLQYLLQQPYSKDTIYAVLGLNKQVCGDI